MLRRTACLMSASLLYAIPARAQNPPSSSASPPAQVTVPGYRFRVLGVYDASTGDPVEGVEVADVLNGNKSVTTKTGTVSLIFLPDGGALVRLRKLGYATQTLTVAISPSDTTPMTVVLERAAQLPAVVVNDSAKKALSPMLAGFEDRRARGFGHFITDSVFRSHDNQTLADLIPTHMPGLQITPGPGGAKYFASGRKQCAGFVLLKMKATGQPTCNPGAPPSCFVSVYIDGVPIYDATMDSTRIPDFNHYGALDYAAAEFYQGSEIPVEYNTSRNQDCGVLLLWTRIK